MSRRSNTLGVPGFWYINLFQPPGGPAEMEADADVARWLYTMYWAVSGDSPPKTWINQLQAPEETPFTSVSSDLAAPLLPLLLLLLLLFRLLLLPFPVVSPKALS